MGKGLVIRTSEKRLTGEYHTGTEDVLIIFLKTGGRVELGVLKAWY